MKKILFLFLLIKISVCHAQTPLRVETIPGSTYVYVGSLTQSSDDSGNSQKIIIKIFGGSWFGDSDGETAFFISNRGGLTVNETSLGSNMGGRLALRAYQNGGNVDFYIVPSANDYTSFAVTSYLFGYIQPSQYVNITTQTTAPTATDITASLTINPVMIADASGNIGIGTTNPNAYKLAVKGNIHAKQVNVDLNNWSDYVFNPEYPLKSLSEVKAYIDKNHHLPDIPSEQQMVKTGLDVGEMNKLLMKKVEELTLYMIEKDQKEKEQEARIKKLEEAVAKLTDKNTPPK